MCRTTSHTHGALVVGLQRCQCQFEWASIVGISGAFDQRLLPPTTTLKWKLVDEMAQNIPLYRSMTPGMSIYHVSARVRYPFGMFLFHVRYLSEGTHPSGISIWDFRSATDMHLDTLPEGKASEVDIHIVSRATVWKISGLDEHARWI